MDLHVITSRGAVLVLQVVNGKPVIPATPPVAEPGQVPHATSTR